jgi:hypothetical protein
MHETPVAAPEVRRIASAGLLGADPPIGLADGRWPIVLSGLEFHRLTGIAAAAWEAGCLELDDEHVAELFARHREAMVGALVIEQRLLRLAAAFDAAGVRAVVLKGPAVAHAVYADPSMRPFGDLDLLVATSDWRGACAVLESEGYRRDLPEPRRGFDERFGKAATHSDESGIQVDLHRTLVLGPFGLWLDPAELLRHTEAFELGGRRLERLDRTGLLVNAALHAGLGASPPLLLPLCDVVRTAVDPRVDWTRVESLAARRHQGAALGLAFEAAERELGAELPAPARAIANRDPGLVERRALRAYTDHRRAGGMAIAATRAIRGVRGKSTYLMDLLLPNREFLDARARGSYLSRWRTPMHWIRRRRRT